MCQILIPDYMIDCVLEAFEHKLIEIRSEFINLSLLKRNQILQEGDQIRYQTLGKEVIGLENLIIELGGNC